jgi:hypothetical protein
MTYVAVTPRAYYERGKSVRPAGTPDDAFTIGGRDVLYVVGTYMDGKRLAC